MIYTLTFNPAVDYVVHAENITRGRVNRSEHEEIYFGGKGINVSVVLKELGVPSRALGFVAGFTGEAIEKGVRDAGVETDFVHLAGGMSRINVKVKAGAETEINGSGPDIPADKLEELFVKLDGLRTGDMLIMAGSIPPSLPEDMYERIAERLAGKGIHIAADASGKLLMNVLHYKPFLVKPNDTELGEMFGVTADSTEDIIKYGSRLMELGAKNVLVSRAEKGAVLLDGEGGVHVCGACRGEVKNSVGAGDSMLAGFLAGIDRGYGYALKLGTAAGGAAAFSEGLPTGDMIYKMMEQL